MRLLVYIRTSGLLLLYEVGSHILLIFHTNIHRHENTLLTFIYQIPVKQVLNYSFSHQMTNLQAKELQETSIYYSQISMEFMRN